MVLLSKKKKNLLDKLYFDKKLGFGSMVDLYDRAKKHGVTLSETRKYLSSVPAYSRHKTVPRPRNSIWNRWIHASYPGEVVAVDVWYLGTGTKSKFPHVLLAVDVFSKYGAVAPLFNLTSQNVAKAMEKIIDNFKFKIS